MKLKIFDLLNKIESTFLVLNNNQIIYMNQYFLQEYLQEFNFDISSVDNLHRYWEIKNSDDELCIVNKNTKIKHKSSFLTEFIENENNSLQFHKVYKFQKNINFF